MNSPRSRVVPLLNADAARPYPRREPGAISRRDQLLDEAARQLNSKGISLTSMTDVADKLGFSRASLYYYIEDREDLMFQVYRRSSEIMARRLGEAIASQPSAMQVVETFVSRVLDPGEPELAALSEIGLLNREGRETVLGIHEAVIARLASMLEAGAKAGQIRTCDFCIVARVIIGIIHSIPLHATLASSLNVSRQEVISTAVEMLTNGWAADRSALVPWLPIDLSSLIARPGDVFDRGALLEAKRDKILSTASQLFNRRGVDTTSLDDIAGAVGVTKRTLYTHVGDKRTILSACYARTHRIHCYIGEQAISRGQTANERLTAALRSTLVAQQREDIEPLRASAGFESLSPAERLVAVKRGKQLVQTYRALCTQAQREGSMRKLHCDCLLILMRSAGAWLAKGLVRGDDQRKAQIAGQITDVMRLGLSPLG
jgi:AcrR family transcriptional regulator